MLLSGLKPSPKSVADKWRNYQLFRVAVVCVAIALFGFLGVVLITAGSGSTVLPLEFPWLRKQFMVAVKPEFNGLSLDGNPFRLSASEASHTMLSDRYMYFKNPSGWFGSADKLTEISLDALVGTLDGEQQILEFPGPVIISGTDGVSGEFGHAVVDLGTGKISMSDSVAFNMSGHALFADSGEISEGGNILQFMGRVRVFFPALEVGAQQ